MLEQVLQMNRPLRSILRKIINIAVPNRASKLTRLALLFWFAINKEEFMS